MRSDGLTRMTSPTSESKIPNPNQSEFPCKPVPVYSQIHKKSMTAGFANSLSLRLFCCTAMIPREAATRERMSQMNIIPSTYIHVIASPIGSGEAASSLIGDCFQLTPSQSHEPDYLFFFFCLI